MPAVAPKNLFVGPRPIAKGEQIFGRDPEIQRLTHLLLAERIVLLHSPSGAGKTSLIQAGFIPALVAETEDEFYVPPIVRLSLLTSAVATPAAVNPNRAGELGNVCRVSPIESIEEHVETRVKPNAQGRSICLIFDQFEECVTFLPEDELARNALFLDLRRTLTDPNIWALFAAREDFLAPIVELGNVLPTRFKQTFRLDFLDKAEAHNVIRKTADLGGYSFAEDALTHLVNDLAIVNVQELDGRFRLRPGEYVEPLHLQVACRHILQKLPASINRIESSDLSSRTTEGPRPESSVDEALAAYYKSELAEITTGDPVLERDIRFWIQENLIDPSGIRIPILQGPVTTAGLPNQTIDKLYSVYLVRRERRLNATWYELAHDRLVRPILADNKAWFDHNLGLIGRSCREWIRSGRGSSHLLNSRDLTDALRQWQTKARTFSNEEVAFLTASRQAKRRAQLRFWLPLGGSLAIAAGFAAFAFSLWRTTHDLTYYRQFSALRPLYAPWTPASADRSILFASQLAADLSRKKTPIDPLLAGDVIGLLDRALERRPRLLETHWNYKFPDSAPSVGDRLPVHALTFSPDGQTLAIGDKLGSDNGRVRFFRDGVLSPAIEIGEGQVNALTFSPDGSRLAVGTNRGFVAILDATSAQGSAPIVRLRYPGTSDQRNAWSCAWNAAGALGVACQDGHVYVWPHLSDSMQNEPIDPPVVLENRVNNDSEPVHAIAWDDQGTMLAIGDAAGKLRVWNGSVLSPPAQAHSNAIWSVAFAKDGRIACGSWDRSISVWKVDQPGAAPVKVNSLAQAHDHWVRGVVWVNDDQALASVGEDGFVKFWKSADLGRISFEQSPTTQIWRLAYNPVKKIVATADNDGAIRFYRSEAPRLQTHGNHANDVISLGFRNDDVLSLDLDGAVTTFHPVSGQEEQSKLPVQFQSGIRLARYQPNLNRFVIGYGRSAAGSGQLVTWDPRDPTKVQQTNLPQPIVSLDCHPTEPMLGFVTGQAILGLRRLPDLANLPSQPDFPIQRDSEMRSPGRVAWSRAVGVLTVVLSHAKKDLSEVARFAYDGRKLTELEPLKVPARISTISWHPKEDVVAIGTTAGSVFLGSVKGGLTEFLPGHDGAVRTLTWSADGQRLFSGGDDRSAKVWEYKPTNKFKLTLLTTLLPPNGAILAIATAPDRKGVYLAGTDPKISYWSQDHYFADAILTRAQQRVNRNMFRAEWLRYTESDPARQAKYEKTFANLPALYESESP